MEPQMPAGVDPQAIQEALQRHIQNGAPTPPPAAPMPTPAQGGLKKDPTGGFDKDTKVLAKALIQKLLSVV